MPDLSIENREGENQNQMTDAESARDEKINDDANAERKQKYIAWVKEISSEKGGDSASDVREEESVMLSFPEAESRPPLPALEAPDQTDDEGQAKRKSRKRPSLRALPILAGVVLLAAVFFILHFALKPSEPAGEENKTSSEAAAETPSVSETVTPSVTIDQAAAETPSVPEAMMPSLTDDLTAASLSPSSPAPTQTSDVIISLPDEYQIWGTGEYKLSYQEHDLLLKDVHHYVEEKVSEYTKTKDAFYPHFESIAVNEDCTLFTVTVNDGYTRTPYEIGLPEQLRYYSALYAAFSQKKAESFTIVYQSMVGNLLASDSYPVS